MTVGSIGATGQSSATGKAKDAGGSDPAAFAAILAAFKKEAAKTPAERARDQVLKQHNLTEDSYKALPPDQKKAIDAEIATAVQRVLHADKGKGFRGAQSAADVGAGTAGGLSDFLSA
jgi:hypothetical protein